MYAQTNYLQVQGRRNPDNVPSHQPKYSISEIGCLVTSKANLLDRMGRGKGSPLDLNAIFRDRNIYIDAAPKDAILDDLGWNSITAVDPQVVVVRTGSGWPTGEGAKNSILKFEYISPRLHVKTTHFCMVDDPEKGTIIDSWDGKSKKPGIYGEPVAFATYGISNPQPIVPVTAAAPRAHVGQILFLPAAAGYWRVYPLGGQVIVGKEKGKLWPGNPEWAPGLEYEILDCPAPNVYTIDTGAFGRVNIYAGPDTIAQFRDKPQPPAPAPAPAPAAPVSIPVVTEPAVVPAPAVATEVVPAPAAEVPTITPEPVVEAPVVPPAPKVDDWKATREDDLITYQAKEDVHVKDENGVGRELLLHLNQYFKCRYRYTKTDADGKKTVWVQPEFSVSQNSMYLIPQTSLKVLSADISDDEEKEIYDKLDMTLQEVGYKKKQIDEEVAKKKKVLLPIVAWIEGTFLRIRAKFKKQKANK